MESIGQAYKALDKLRYLAIRERAVFMDFVLTVFTKIVEPVQVVGRGQQEQLVCIGACMN